MTTPSTGWQERIAPDEEARFAEFGRAFAELQQRKSAKYGPGRVLHRKQLLSLRATLDVLPDLPAHARHGAFAAPGRLDVSIRLSNGATDKLKDLRPDLRGFALKLHLPEGPGALGGTTTVQDLLLINRDRLPFPTSEFFVGLTVAGAKGGLAPLLFVFGNYGLIKGWRLLAGVLEMMRAPFHGFAASPFFSVAPMTCGPYAVRVRLLPPAGQPPAVHAPDLGADLMGRLRAGPLVYTLQLQFFVDEARTPIEEVTVAWPDDVAPWLSVGTLTIPPQEEDPAFAAQVEAMTFDPWAGLMAHRPLGEVMRARKVVYLVSQRGRGVAV